MRHVVAARYLERYEIWLKFDDGAERVVDLEGELTGEVFAPLRDLEVFRTVALDSELDTITWETGADFAPEFLYEIGEPLEDRTTGRPPQEGAPG